jgi:hypothetical protein
VGALILTRFIGSLLYGFEPDRPADVFDGIIVSGRRCTSRELSSRKAGDAGRPDIRTEMPVAAALFRLSRREIHWVIPGAAC